MKGNQPLLDQLSVAARRGDISRRDFLSTATAAGFSTTLATNLWSSQAFAQPQRGGTFRWGIHDGNTGDTHDPGTYVSRQQIYLAHQHRSYLTLIEPDNSLGPDLATDWEATPNAAEWTFELNRKATFHSGRAVTSKDVIASLNHHRGDTSNSSAKSLLTDVDDIVADGDHTVVVKLLRGNADLPWLMTDYHLAICPARDDGTIDWESGDGCGPFKIERGEFGVQWELTRHDGWHLEGPYFDKLELVVFNDPIARETALLSGDVDAISLVELKNLKTLEQRTDIEIDNVPSGAAITLPMHCDVNFR